MNRSILTTAPAGLQEKAKNLIQLIVTYGNKTEFFKKYDIECRFSAVETSDLIFQSVSLMGPEYT